MKRLMSLLVLVFLVVGLGIFNGCKKDPVAPTLNTEAVTNVSLTSATSGGTITNTGGSDIIAFGVSWGTTSNPTISGSHTIDGKGAGSFVSNVTGLTPNTLYYLRAYATNSVGTSYGDEVTFTTTPISLVTITTTAVTSISLTTAISGGNITSDGGGAVTAKGVCWATTTNPTIANSKTSDGTGTGLYVSNLTGLQPGTTYYLRAYATNSAGTAYGNSVSFTTSQIVVPTLTSAPITGITLTTAISGGNITSDGGGTITKRGVCWALTANPTISNPKTEDATGIGTFVSNLTSLEPGKTYYVRSYATNSAGTAYGNELSFVTTPIGAATLTTNVVSSITLTNAVSGGNIVSDGGGAITQKGICWATTVNPTISSPTKTTEGSGSGNFTSNLTGLTPGTIYYVRAYATNSAGTAYGNEVSFSTNQIVLATLTTTTISSITTTTATSGGNITADGGGTITARGVCWATTSTPTTSNFTAPTGSGSGSFSSNLTGLTPGTTYYVRAYAINSAGTAYGNVLSFTTTPVVIPTLTTTSASSITQTSAVSGGNITSDGNGSVTARGICWATTANPTTSNSTFPSGTGIGSFTGNLTGLTPGTTYYIRAYATNSAGTAYGAQISFVTLPVLLPTVTTNIISSITTTTATSGGNVTADGGGVIIAKGVCWAETTNPTINNFKTSDGSGTGTFTSNLSSLSPNTTYYLRSYATNSAGTNYGTERIFKTFAAMDVEGNLYNSVTIGTQTWFSENLRTSKYNNGVSIPTTTTIDLTGEATPKYQWVYNNDNANLATYGRLYTFFAVTDPAGVCPTGWHVPSDAEWLTLRQFLIDNGFAFTSGLDDIAKSLASSSGWTVDPTAGNVGNNQASNNTTGFSALPAGFRRSNGDPIVFNELNSGTYIRSSTEDTSPFSWYYSLNYNKSILDRMRYASFNGYSVRCIK